VFIELIDQLRCPREHEDSWLVAAFSKMEQRFVIQGKLGCPVCAASWPITGGIADFREAGEAIDDGESHAAEAGDDDAVRFGAMLGLTKPGMTVLLEGRAAGVAAAVVHMTGARIIVVNPAAPVGEVEGVAIVRCGKRLPVAAASLDGAVLEARATPVTEAERALKPGGRLAVPASTDLGDRFSVLAEDERSKVAELTGPLISLGRPSPRRSRR
jgi:hypothetical protein